MNIRLSPEEIRLRLTYSEAKDLITEKKLTDEIFFPNGEKRRIIAEILDGTSQVSLLPGPEYHFQIPCGTLKAELEEKPSRNSGIYRAGSKCCAIRVEVDLKGWGRSANGKLAA